MSNKNRRLPPIKKDAGRLVQRSVSIERNGADGGPLRVVIATESPVLEMDNDRGIMVNRAFDMDGMVLRGNRPQIPIVDSHDDRTIRNIHGSLRGLEVVGNELVGSAYFASDPESQSAFSKLNEGHITDFSITAMPLEVMEVKEGQSYTTSRGTQLDGPVEVVTRWHPLNASIVANGADELSTVRRSYDAENSKERTMDETLLAPFIAAGMPEGLTDTEQILAWIAGNMQAKSTADQAPADTVENELDDEETPAADPPVPTEEEERELGEEEEKIEQSVKRALQADRIRRKKIQDACKLARVERAFADKLCDEGVSVAAANERIIRKIAGRPMGTNYNGDGGGVRVAESEQDRVRNAAVDGILMRSYRNAGIRRGTYTGGDKPSAHAEEFSRLSLSKVAEIIVRGMGCRTERMSNIDVAKVAMGNSDALRRFRVERSAWHTTGTFPSLMLDASNKTLAAAYEEAPYTWTAWARQASSVDDFREINRIRFSESPDPEMVAERAPYPEKKFSDSRETYKVEKYGAMFSVSWETIVNDDLDAISRVPAMHGNACRRKQNKVVYEALTSNPRMGDGVALFHSDHGNLAGSSAAPSVTTLNTAFLAMMTQTGLNDDVIINVVPRNLIVPAALSATAAELLSSLARPEVGGSVAGNSNTNNIYGPNGSRVLNLIVEPQLDLNSATTWYLSADPSQIDTVELSFLSGEESPVIENEWDFERDVYRYKVRQTFGVKAIDWRGLYKYAV